MQREKRKKKNALIGRALYPEKIRNEIMEYENRRDYTAELILFKIILLLK